MPRWLTILGLRGTAEPLIVSADWRSLAVRVEFEAVFHTASVWINGQMAGEHRGKGYTAFTFDVTQLLHWGETNAIAVRVDNAFNEHMLPRGRSSDWAHDGGIFRPVQLLITPRVFVERVEIEASPNLTSGDGTIAITSFIRNTSLESWNGKASASDFVDLAPKAVTSRRSRDSQQTSNFLPLVFSSPKRQNSGVSLAELSNDFFEVQASIDLADPSIGCPGIWEFIKFSDQSEASRLGRIAAKRATEGHQEKSVLGGGKGRADTIQVTGNLRDSILHQFSGWALISEENLRPLTGLFPNLMTGQSHVGPNRPSCTIHVPVPPGQGSRRHSHKAT